MSEVVSETQVRYTSIEHRRQRKRRNNQPIVELTLIDALGAGKMIEGTARDPGSDSVSMLIKEQVQLGQVVDLLVIKDGNRMGPKRAEITRCRPLTTGRYEVVAEYRKAAAPQVEAMVKPGRKKLNRPLRPAVTL